MNDVNEMMNDQYYMMCEEMHCEDISLAGSMALAAGSGVQICSKKGVRYPTVRVSQSYNLHYARYQWTAMHSRVQFVLLGVEDDGSDAREKGCICAL